MYENQNPHYKPINSRPNPFSIRLPATPFIQKAAFVESVCAMLVESRYGPGRTCQLVVSLSDRPELGSGVFFDLSDGDLIPCYALSPVGRNGYQVAEAEYRKAKQMGLLEPCRSGRSATPASPSTLGRGSPWE